MIQKDFRRAQAHDSIFVAVVADRDTVRGALLALIDEDSELRIAGSASSALEAHLLLDLEQLDVMLVNLPLSNRPDPEGLNFIRHVKGRRPNVGIVSLKRDVDEHCLRAALDAGADACCMATTSQNRLVQAIKAVAAGATWLDPEISTILLHRPVGPLGAIKAGGPHLSPREREILRLLTDGYTNEEIADRLTCAPATVKTHLLHLFRKLGVRDRVSAAVAALRGDLI
ncbi:MAG: response regulator transcription factor [Vulcanimicrobiaceae bacterium]